MAYLAQIRSRSPSMHAAGSRRATVKQIVIALGVNVLVLAGIPGAGISEPGGWLPDDTRTAPAGYLVEGRYSGEDIIRLVPHQTFAQQAGV